MMDTSFFGQNFIFSIHMANQEADIHRHAEKIMTMGHESFQNYLWK